MPKSPDEMRPSERLEEITLILAEGILRLKRKKAFKTNRLNEKQLDISAKRIVHATNPKTEKANE